MMKINQAGEVDEIKELTCQYSACKEYDKETMQPIPMDLIVRRYYGCPYGCLYAVHPDCYGGKDDTDETEMQEDVVEVAEEEDQDSEEDFPMESYIDNLPRLEQPDYAVRMCSTHYLKEPLKRVI